jgi:protocatechuate 3,4-dioxygenase beta subunit
MNRRQWLTMFVSGMAVLRWPRHADAQDAPYVRAVKSAFSEFAATTVSTGRIASPGEPGVPLVVNGTLLGADGRTPLGGALVFAYHTDRDGLYNPNQATHSWRLRGAVRTAADGSFEFRTIRPASYPQTRIPQHIHVALQTADGNYHAGEWRFADDPMVDEQERAASQQAGEFGWVRPVRPMGSAGHAIAVKVRVDPGRAFS